MNSNSVDFQNAPAQDPVPCHDVWVTLSGDEFRASDLPRPLVFEGDAATIQAQPLREIYSYWADFPRIDGVPHIEKLDPLQFRNALGNVMLVEPVDDGEDFRYRLYGSNITARVGRDMTGKRVSEVGTASCVSKFFLRSYIAVMQTRRAYRTIHIPPALVTISDWERLLLPVCNEAGIIDQILVGNFPGPWRPVIDTAPYAIARD